MSDFVPYRESSITVPLAPSEVSFWTSVRAFFTPHARGVQQQWYRRAIGGRWSYHHYRDYSSDPWTSEWVSLPHCPAEGPEEVFLRGDYNSWSCREGKCHCEVW